MAKKVKETKATKSPTQSSQGNPKRPKPTAPEVEADKTRVERFKKPIMPDPMANTPEKSMTEVVIGNAKDIIGKVGRIMVSPYIPFPIPGGQKGGVEKAKENIEPKKSKYAFDITLPEIEVTPQKPKKRGLKPNTPKSKMEKTVEKANNDKNVIENNRREDDGSLEYLENKH